MKNKLLLVTFPVDFGSTTMETLLIQTLENTVDLKVYRFAPNPNRKFKHKGNIKDRFFSSYNLWKEILNAQNEGRKILFQGISPALFAYPAVTHGSSYIITDWTRKLDEGLPYKHLPSSSWLTLIHKIVMNKQKYIFGVTDAVVDEIIRDYGVPKHKIKKTKFPFSSHLDLFIPSPTRKDEEVRLLFVGGDFHRKGGDILLNWFLQQDNSNLKLTMVTKNKVEQHPKLTIKNNIDFGQSEHIELFKNHDIFVLPTRRDAYPVVLGEAACTGLAVLTTKNALGAPEIVNNGVNGYISDSQEDLLDHLNTLVNNKYLIESMKRKSREFMKREFSLNLVLKDYMDYIFEQTG